MSNASPPPPTAPAWAEAKPPPPPSPPPPATQPPGWYPDPWHVQPWRWWDGNIWTGHTCPGAGQPLSASVEPERRPRLPAFLSPPVVIAAVPSIALIVFTAIAVPIAIVLGLVPLVIVAPVLWWMDRIEPESWSERLHAFLWGAFVAGLTALFINSLVAFGTGSETVAAVVSAPIVEESMKALAIVWAVRRNNVDGIMDGLVYAGWSGLGFAIVEDFSYFFAADGEDLLLETFIGRALLTPFAHPLFTAWTGLAIGIAVRTRRPLSSAWWGLATAVGTHAIWNGSLSLAESEGGAIVAVVTMIAFFALFVATVIAVIVLRRRDHRRLRELSPTIAQRYRVDLARVAELVDHRRRRQLRRTLDRSERGAFDREAGALTRLGYLLDHRSPPKPGDEARLLSQVAAARAESGD